MNIPEKPKPSKAARAEEEARIKSESLAEYLKRLHAEQN